MLQRVLYGITKDNKNNFKNDKLKEINLYITSKKYLYYKYSKFKYSYSLFCTNNLIYNEKCRIVARFKDYLVLDDSTEFLRRFYSHKELKLRLNKIFNFYENYCKIFPNYMILPENKFLYRNIRKKQKMIDAFNEIKKEEEENRKHLKLDLINDDKNENKFFNEKVQESIEKYNPSISNILCYTMISEINNKLNDEIELNDKSLISISLNSYKQFIFNENENNSLNKFNFDENEKNIINNSFNSEKTVFSIIKILNNKKENKKKENKNNKTELNNNKIIKNKKNKIKINKKENINFSNTNINNNNIKINKTNNNLNNKSQKNKKFILHKQNGSVPVASNLLNNENNCNNIIDETKTVKIIHNINNIIINDEINNIKNRMIININNNYFQFKDSKNQNKNIKSKEKKEKIKKLDINREGILNFRERRTYTTYNTQNNKNKKNLLNTEMLSPKKKENSKIKNFDSKTINKNFNINSNKINKNKINKIYRNENNFITNKLFKNNNNKLIESKTLNNNLKKNKTENNNLFGNKLKISKNKKIKEKLKIKSFGESIDNTKISINRKIVNNYLTTTKKKKKFQGAFNVYESISLNNLSNNNRNYEISYNITDKNETLNSIKNNSIKFNLNNKRILHKPKTNSMQIKNKDYILSSINVVKERIQNIENNIENKNKMIINNKTQIISKKEVNTENINNKNNILSKKNLKKEKEKKDINNKNEVKKINAKEMKEKYHKLLKENTFTHGSYDNQNRLHLFKKFKTLNKNNENLSNTNSYSINNKTISSKNNKSPITKKYILSPSEKIKDIINNYIKTPIKSRYSVTHKQSKFDKNIVTESYENKFNIKKNKNN